MEHRIQQKTLRAGTVRGALLVLAVLAMGCHPRPILGGTKLDVGGTIAGIVRGTDDTVRLVGRRVTAVDIDSGARFDTTTGTTGGYTLEVPQGTYRVEVELRANETLASRPDETHITASDLDASRDFEITVRPPATTR